jgi:hypothetical protein
MVACGKVGVLDLENIPILGERKQVDGQRDEFGHTGRRDEARQPPQKQKRLTITSNGRNIRLIPIEPLLHAKSFFSFVLHCDGSTGCTLYTVMLVIIRAFIKMYFMFMLPIAS